jgi:hypothetical protein
MGSDKRKDKDEWQMTAAGAVPAAESQTEPKMRADGAVEVPKGDSKARMTGHGAEQVSGDQSEPRMTASGSVMPEEPQEDEGENGPSRGKRPPASR